VQDAFTRILRCDENCQSLAAMTSPLRTPPPSQLASVRERVDVTWQALVTAIIVRGSPSLASVALQDFQGHIDNGYFKLLFEHAEPSYTSALGTLRILKDRAGVLAAVWTGVSRGCAALGAAAGMTVTLANLLSSTAKGTNAAWGVCVGVTLVLFAVAGGAVGEFRSKRWDQVLKDFETLLADARRQGSVK
jgi:hypothetical protein